MYHYVHYVHCFNLSKLGEGDYRLIYRHYATLYFVFCVDSSESQLGILDLIQVRTKHIFRFSFVLFLVLHM